MYDYLKAFRPVHNTSQEKLPEHEYNTTKTIFWKVIRNFNNTYSKPSTVLALIK